MITNGPTRFRVGLQGLAAQSTMGAELKAEALPMKEAVFRENMMEQLRVKGGFDSVPLYIDNTPALCTRRVIVPNPLGHKHIARGGEGIQYQGSCSARTCSKTTSTSAVRGI